MQMAKREPIYPESFFNIPHPAAPWVSIQFRTRIPKKETIISDPSHWEEITLNPSNHFDSITIEDLSGFQKLTLRLFDRDFAKMESIIVKSIIAARDFNPLKEGDNVRSDETTFFEFKISHHAMINVRVRFGYAVSLTPTQTIQDSEFTGVNYSDRIAENKSKMPVIKSPWLYFQLFTSKFDLTDAGLSVELTGMSVTDSFLSRAKLAKKFAILRGKPREVITALDGIISRISNNELRFIIDDPPKLIEKDGDLDAEIDIILGSSPDVAGWRTVKSVLNEICSKIPPKILDTDDKEPETQDSDAEGQKLDKSISYTYSFSQREVAEGEKKKIVGEIHFFYPSPESFIAQKTIRTYFWRNYSLSIVKGFSVNSQLDFASLNRQIFIRDGNELKCYVTKVSKDDLTRTTAPEPIDLEKAYEAIEEMTKTDYKIAFVSDTISLSKGGKTPLGVVAQQVVSHLNEGVFEGSVDLPGDPFYLFDAKLKPYQYMIRIIIMRPAYITKDGERVEEEASYLSGDYVLKGITHTINSSGFSTVLAVTRWPTKT